MATTETEQHQSRLKELIAKGKEQGFLTYSEVNDHLPDDISDSDQIEDIISMINDMGITVYESAEAAPDADETQIIAVRFKPVPDGSGGVKYQAVSDWTIDLSTIGSRLKASLCRRYWKPRFSPAVEWSDTVCVAVGVLHDVVQLAYGILWRARIFLTYIRLIQIECSLLTRLKR